MFSFIFSNINEKVEKIIKNMTLKEKIAQKLVEHNPDLLEGAL